MPVRFLLSVEGTNVARKVRGRAYDVQEVRGLLCAVEVDCAEEMRL